MADNAKMHFNIGLILATLEDHERAVSKAVKNVMKEPHMGFAMWHTQILHLFFFFLFSVYSKKKTATFFLYKLIKK